MAQQYKEGDVADGPGGQSLVFKSGRWVSQRAAIGGPVVLGTPNAKAPYDGPQAAAELLRAQAVAANAAAQQAADTRIKNAQAEEQERKNRQQRDAEQADKQTPASLPFGKAGLAALPSNMQGIVRGILEGNLPVGSRALTSPQMVPYIKAAMAIDPTFTAASYPTRAAFRKDLIDGKDGVSVDALNTAMEHAGKLPNAVAALNNKTGFLGTLLQNPVGNALSQASGKSAVPVAISQLTKFGEEANKVYVPTNGGQAERQGVIKELPINGSPEQQYGVLKSDVDFFRGKMNAIDAKGKRVLGPTFDVNDLLSPGAKDSIAYYSKLDPTNIAADGSHRGQPAFRIGGAGLAGASDIGGGIPGGPPPPPNGGGDPPTLSGTGPTRTERDHDREAAVRALIMNGTSPDEIARQYPGTDTSLIPRIQANLKKNRNYLFRVNSTKEVPQSLLNRAVSNPGMVGAMSALDAIMPMGIYGKDAKDAMDKAKEAAPTASLIGSLIGGVPAAIGGEALAARGLGALGMGAERLATWAPRIGDAAYGAEQGYGNAAPGSGATGALTGAATGMASGMFGRNMVRQVGATAQGVMGRDAADYLRSQYVPTTVGQYLGGTAKQIEDQLTGYPIIGRIIKARRDEGLTGFNQAAFRQGSLGDPLVTNIGERGAEQMDGAVTRAYAPLDNATVNLDPQLSGDLLNAQRQAAAIPGREGDYNFLANRYIGTNLPAGVDTASGQRVQEAARQLRAAGANQGAGANLPGEFSDVTGQAANALDGAITRSSPEAAASLAQGNEVFRNQNILDEAVTAARATRGPDGDAMFMPSQLANAAVANAKNYGGKSFAATTDRPFYDLTSAGQEVLPSKVADSGTAGRLMLGMAATAIAGGAGAGGAEDGLQGAGEGGIGTLALLAGAGALGGSRVGQRAIISALADRPDLARRIGGQIYNSASATPIGGALGIPLINALRGVSAP